MLLTAFSHLEPVVGEQVTVDGDAVALAARTVAREAACPDCGAVFGRVHGVYRRRLADLAMAGRKVVIDLAVRRFLCLVAECSRRTFANGVKRIKRDGCSRAGFDLLRLQILLAD